MKDVSFCPVKLFHLLSQAIPKSEAINSEESLEMIIDLENLLKYIKSQDPVDVFEFLFDVLDNTELVPHLRKSLGIVFRDEFTIMKEANQKITGTSREMAEFCAKKAMAF